MSRLKIGRALWPKRAGEVIQTQWAKDTAPVVNRANEETIKRMEERIKELETCIAEFWASHDECSFDILNRVCDGCRCERREKK